MEYSWAGDCTTLSPSSKQKKSCEDEQGTAHIWLLAVWPFLFLVIYWPCTPFCLVSTLGSTCPFAHLLLNCLPPLFLSVSTFIFFSVHNFLPQSFLTFFPLEFLEKLLNLHRSKCPPFMQSPSHILQAITMSLLHFYTKYMVLFALECVCLWVYVCACTCVSMSLVVSSCFIKMQLCSHSLLQRTELRFNKDCRDPNLITAALCLLECSHSPSHTLFNARTHSHSYTLLWRLRYSPILTQPVPISHHITFI